MDKRLTGSRGLQELGRKYNKSIPQIILRWHLDTKVIPVFMSNKAERIRENANIYDFSLQQCEIEDINSLNINYKLFVESDFYCCWGNGFDGIYQHFLYVDSNHSVYSEYLYQGTAHAKAV